MEEDATDLNGSSALFKDLTQDNISRSVGSEQNPGLQPLFRPTANPRLTDGKSLPPSWKKHFKPESMACKPLQEIDPAYNETFIVLGKGGTIHRIAKSDSLFLLHPLNPLRKGAIYLTTHYIFSAFIVALVLLNVFALVNEEYWFDYACIVIYFLEFNLKVLSRGLVWGEFTCLRNPWSYLDILTILTSVLRPWDLKVILILQWFRILKIVPLIKVMRDAFETILSCIHQLFSAMLLGLMSLGFIATIGLNIYMGIMTQRCIKNSEFHLNNNNIGYDQINKEFLEHHMNSSNWIPDSLCGNSTNSGMCSNASTCHQGFGPNPDFGYTNFDSFIWSFLQAWRIVSQDFLEELISQIMETTGHYLFYPLFSYFIGTFLVGVFVNGLVAQYFETYFQQYEENSENNAKVVNDQPAENNNPTHRIKNAMKKIADHFGFEVFITVVIFLDGFCFFWNMADDTGFTQYNTLVVLILYGAEFVIKMNGYWADKYFKERWNIFDFTIVILTAISEFARRSGLQRFGFLVSCIRLFKIAPRWAGLNNMLKITMESLRQFCGIYGLASTFWILLALVGKESFGHFYTENVQLFPDGQLPRYNFVDVTHSLLEVFRSWCKETVEIFWDCMLVAGLNCPAYFASVQLLGIIFVTVITISIVILTMKFLSAIAQNDDKPQSTLTKMWNLVFTNPIKLMKEKFTPKAKDHEKAKVLQRNDSEDVDGEEVVEVYAEKTSPLPSNTAEHLSKLRNCLDSQPVLIISIVLITLSSILLTFEKPNVPQQNDSDTIMIQSAIFYADIIFAIFLLCIVLNVVCTGVCNCLSSLVWILEVAILFEIVLHLFLDSGFVGLVVIRSLRPMLLLMTIERLKAVLLGIWNVLQTAFTYIASLIYVWFFFAVIMNALYRNSFTWCYPVGKDVLDDVKYSHNKENCLIGNHSWQTASHNFDDGAQSLVATFILPTRNGWITIMHDAYDATTSGEHAQKENNLGNSFTLFIPFYVFGVLISASIIIGVVSSKLRQCPELFFTSQSYKKYFESRNFESSEPDIMASRPESGCRGKLFDLINSKTFNGFVMFTMIFTFILLSAESYKVSRFQEIVFEVLYSIVALLLFVEVVLKIIGLGKHFFSSAWNWFDLLTLVLMVAGTMLSDLVKKYFISPVICVLIRVLRLATNSLFLSMFPTIKTLFKTFHLVKPVLFSILLFHAILIWSYALFWGAVFGHLEHSVRPLSSPFMAMYLLSAFQGVDLIYLMLSNEVDCGTEVRYAPGDCGHWGIATVFVFSYIFLSIILTINLYLVFILELVHQLNLAKAAAASKGNRFDMELTNVKKDGEDGELQRVDIKENV